MNEQKKIKIVAEVETSLGNMDKTINKLEQGLRKQNFDLSKNSGIAKLIKQYKDAKKDFDALAVDGFIDQTDVKKAQQAGEKISKIYREIHQSFAKIQANDKDAFKDLFPKKFSSQVEKGTRAIDSFFSNLTKKKNQETGLDNARKDLERLNTQLDNLKGQRIKVEVDADIDKAQKKLEELKRQREEIIKSFEKRITPDGVYGDDGKKLDKEIIEKKVAEGKNKLEALTEKSKKLTKGTLTPKDEKEIQDLKDSLNSQTTKHRENVAKGVLRKYQEELQKRDVAIEANTPDTGRAKRSLGKLTREDLEEKIAEATQELREIEKQKEKIKKEIEEIEARPGKRLQQQKKNVESQKKAAQDEIDAAEDELRAYKDLEKKQQEYVNTQTQLFSEGKTSALNTEEEVKQLESLDAQLEETAENIKKFKNEKTFSSQKEKDDKVSGKEGEIRNKELAIAEFERKIEDLKNLTDIDKIFEKLADFNIDIEGIERSEDGLRKIKQNLESLDDRTVNSIKTSLAEMGIEGEEAEKAIKELALGLDQVTDKNEELKRSAQEIENLKEQVKYFFSLTNAIDLFKRTVSQAAETVKELDAVMTETAVVTDFTIGDMWDKLPEYSANATDLGTSIRGLYGATTLYYQQGLQTEAAMSVGIETMKMARIANLDAADATKAMTAALRGFNMEVNEVNAQRINDVYSELAAITAADTGQIADAMTKTASIAHSANMEFETTAALLAQIIETTQEAPETAGTAMKTIIARFTEVKQLFSEGMLTGEDSEGEIVDINKIDTALRTVGISLKDFLNGSKGIDDIFLELAAKWDTLDLATQRYIATAAAGSRQQSRFIAMMSNYERTMELATAANNSAGASQEQFDKTLDSLAAKTQRLSNAWAEFTMGLANNELIKVGVDILTGLLTVVNKFTDVLSGNNGIAKSLITLTLAITALKGGSALLNKIFGSKLVKTVVESFNKIKSESQKTSAQLTKDTRDGIVEGMKQAAAQAEQYGRQTAQNFNRGVDSENQGRTMTKKIKAKTKTSQPGDSTNQQPADQPLATSVESTAQPLGIKEKLGQAMADSSVQGLRLTGVLTTLTGAGLNWIGTAIKAKDDTNALGAGFEAAGATASIAGSALSLLAPILSTLEVSIGAVAGPIGIVVGAVAVLAFAMQALHNNSPEGKLEQVQKAAEKAGEVANAAAESFNNLNNALDSLDDKYKNLEDLTRGTKEWNQAVRETNQEVLDLIEKYPALAAFVTSKNGVLSFDKTMRNGEQKTFEDVYGEYESAVSNSQSAKIIADVAAEVASQAVTNESLSSYMDSWVNYYNQDAVLSSKQLDAGEMLQNIAQDIAKGNIPGLTLSDPDKNEEILEEYIKNTFDLPAESAASLANHLKDEYLALHQFGEETLLSTEKIKAFNAMLTTQALNKTGISDNNFTEMAENFITDEMIAKIQSDEEEKILEGGISENEKQNYAINVLGGSYENGQFKDATGKVIENVSDDVIAAGLAATETLDEVAKAMANFADKINNIKVTPKGDMAPVGLANLYKKSAGQGLTQQDFKNFGIDYNNISKENLTTQATEIFNSSPELKELYGEDGITEFVNFFVEQFTLGAEAMNRATEKLNEAWWDDKGTVGLFGKQTELDAGSMKNVVNQLYDVFLTSGKGASDEMGAKLKDAFNKITDPEQAQKFADALGTIDWKNIDSVEQLNEILVETGFDATTAGIDIEALENDIKELAKASKKVSLDSLKQQIKSLDELAKNLTEREDTDRVFSDEERKALIQANRDMADDFIMTGIDEWTYVGDSMETLEGAVREATRALWETYSKQTREAGEKSQSWENLAQDNSSSYRKFQDIATEKVQVTDKNAEDLFNEAKTSGLIDENLSFEGFSATDVYELIKASYEQYGAIAVRTQNIANAQNLEGVNTATAYYSSLSGQDVLNTKKTYSGLQMEEDTKARQDALDAKLVTTEGLREEEKALRESNIALQKHNDLTKAAVSDAADHRKKLEKLVEVFKDNEEALSGSAKGTAEYQKAIDKVAVAATDAFGADITSDFVEANLSAFADWANGAEGSTERIRKAILEQIIAQDELYNSSNDIQKAVAGLDSLDFDIYGNADFSQIMNSLKLTEAEAEQFAAMIERLGYTVTWQKYGTPQTDPTTGKKYYNYRSVVSNTAGRVQRTNALGGGGGGNVEYYDNTFDKLYNLVREIGEEVREMARLERKYEKLVNKNEVSAGDLYNNLVEQLGQLGRQQGLNERLRNERKVQMREYLAENADLNKYANIFQNEDGRDVLRINWEQIDAILDPDKGQRVEDYVGQLEDWMDELDDIEQELWNIEDQIEEIYETGKQEYIDLENALKEAVEWSYQEEIDKLSQINDSINDTNTKLINSIQKQVNKIRQDRENEKREEELQEKQRRLMYLTQDTSGANAMQILGLQEEIDNETQDYTDSLIDQKISQLQEQNEKAAEQREKQIQLLQSQLDYAIKSGEIWNKVYALIEGGLDPVDGLVRGSALESLLKRRDGFLGLSELGKMEWLKELEVQAAQAAVYLSDLKNIKPVVNYNTYKYYGGEVEDEKKPTSPGPGPGPGGPPPDTPAESTTFKVYHKSSGQTFYSTGTVDEIKDKFSNNDYYVEFAKDGSPVSGYSKPFSKQSQLKQAYLRFIKGYNIAVDGLWGSASDAAWRALTSKDITEFNQGGEGLRTKLRNMYYRQYGKYPAFKTGGLADFTGPAWLDGTKSRPEMVLNARDTQNFIQLKDILSSLLARTSSNTNTSTENNGDITYDIDINVESIGSDYDLDQVASRIKSLINEDARYRNNNAVHLMR